MTKRSMTKLRTWCDPGSILPPHAEISPLEHGYIERAPVMKKECGGTALREHFGAPVVRSCTWPVRTLELMFTVNQSSTSQQHWVTAVSSGPAKDRLLVYLQ